LFFLLPLKKVMAQIQSDSIAIPRNFKSFAAGSNDPCKALETSSRGIEENERATTDQRRKKAQKLRSKPPLDLRLKQLSETGQ